MDVRSSWKAPAAAIKTAAVRLRAKPHFALIAFTVGGVIAALALLLWLMRPIAVETAVARRGEAVDIVYATGIVDFVREADIASVVAAPIVRVFVEEGRNVRAGALLVQLEDNQQQASLRQLEAQASLARLDTRRTEQLYRRGFASRAALDEAQSQMRAANAAVAAQRAIAANYAVRAPFAGTIIRRDAEPGDLATPSHPLFVLADRRQLRVTADLDERDVARVSVGQRALIRADAFPGQSFEARVAEITPQGDAGTRVFRVRLSLPAESALRPGMNVEANIVTAIRANAVLAPSSAVKEGTVWVVEDGRAHRRSVETGATGASQAEIVRGVEDGERVIVAPPDGLRDGARVSVKAARP